MYSISSQAKLRFDYPIVGSEVEKLVRTFVGNENFVLAQDPEHPERLLVGQGSEHMSDHILITDPSSTIDGILPDKTYSVLIIKSYRWPGCFKIEKDEDLKSLKAIRNFVRKLEQAINTYQQADIG